jgi:hypothetical protein
MAGVPCYRCAPAGTGVGATVLVGSHAHDAVDEPGCGCDDPGCCPEEPCDGPCPCEGDEHGPACCSHSAADPSAPGVRVVLAPTLALSSLPVPPAPTDATHVVDASWDAPVPRDPTETVVLLR